MGIIGRLEGGTEMSLLKRFRDIMASNLNAVIDKAENPEKMLEQYLRELNSELRSARAEMATLEASEQRAKRQLDENMAEMSKFERYALRSLELGNEGDARQFLEKKQQAALEVARLKEAYEQAATDAQMLRQINDKLSEDLRHLEARKVEITGKLASAKAQQKINHFQSSAAKMEDKANRALFEAEALAELNSPNDELDRLMREYTQNESKDDIDNELEALKKRLNGK